MKKLFIIDFLGFIIVKIFSMLFCCIPLHIGLWIGRRGGDFAYLVNSKRRSIGYANLKSAFPEKNICEIKGILRAHFENLGMSIVELLKLPVIGKKYLERHIIFKNFDRIEEALDRGKGIILLAAHSGNWEIPSLAVSAKGHRISVFVREQKYTRLNNLLNKYREMTGCRVITKGFSVREIIKTLNNNGIVGMLGDQDAGPNGVFVDFLNRPASMAPGALTFGLKTGATILPSFTRRIGYDRHVLEIGEPLELINTQDKEKDIKANLEKITDILEDYIRRYPDQWLWSHKRWKSTPQRTILVLSDGKAGHLNQAMAVAEMVEDALGARLKARGIEERSVVRIHVVELRFKNRLARLLLDLVSFFAGRRCQGCLRSLKFCLKKECFDEIKNRYADLIISCGASAAGTNIFLKYENNAKGIVIMKPGLGRKKKFDLVILPRHDAPLTLILSPEGRGKGEGVRSNTLITEAAPNRITEEVIKKAILRITNYPSTSLGTGESRITNHGLGLLIGGDTKTFKLKKETIEKVLSGVLKIADEMDLNIFVSTSRRTSGEIDFFLKDRLGKNSRCKLLVIANEKNIEGVVPAIFGPSEVIIVSPDSISMISEAASSGKYVVVFMEHQPISAAEHQNKYERSIKNLEAQGYIKTAVPDEIYNVIKELLTEKPIVKKLEDRKRIIERLQAIM